MVRSFFNLVVYHRLLLLVLLTAVIPVGKVHSAVVLDREGKLVFDRPAHDEIRTAVVIDREGKLAFDRSTRREAPNVDIIIWSRTKEGDVRITVISPRTDDPEQESDEQDATSTFYEELWLK